MPVDRGARGGPQADRDRDRLVVVEQQRRHGRAGVQAVASGRAGDRVHRIAEVAQPLDVAADRAARHAEPLRRARCRASHGASAAARAASGGGRRSRSSCLQRSQKFRPEPGLNHPYGPRHADEIGRADDGSENAGAAPTPELAISVRGLSKSFGDVRALDGVDLEVAPGHGARPARPQRRRQDDRGARHGDAAAARRRRGLRRRPRRRHATRPRCASGSAWPASTRRSTRTSPAWRTSSWSAACTG